MIAILILTTLLLSIPIVAGFYRLLVGPTYTDRVIGLDILFAVALFACLMAAGLSAAVGIQSATVYLDVAIGLSLTGFVATLSWSRLIKIQPSEIKGKESL